MTPPQRPFVMLDGSTLPLSEINTNLQQISLNVQDNLAQRFTLGTFTLDWSGITHDQFSILDIFKRLMTPTYYMEIVQIDFHVVTTAASNITLHCVGSGLSGWEDVVVAADGTATISSEVENFSAANTADGTLTFTVSSSNNSADLTVCRAVISYRTDRGNAGADHSGYEAGRLAAGSQLQGSFLVDEYTKMVAAVARDTDNNIQQRIQVITIINCGTSPITFPIPASSRRLMGFDIGMIAGDETDHSTWTYKDFNNNVIASATADGNENTYIGAAATGSLPYTQTNEAPADSTKDDHLIFTPTVGDHHFADMVVLYWT